MGGWGRLRGVGQGALRKRKERGRGETGEPRERAKGEEAEATRGSGRQDVPAVFPDLVLGTIVPSTKLRKTARTSPWTVEGSRKLES